MRQVPENPSYLFVGGGRLARHMSSYFEALGVPFANWQRSRHSVSDLQKALKQQPVVLLAIKDDEIAPFYESFKGSDSLFVHFSGALNHPQVVGFHPLMSFGQELYPLNDYIQIHFVGTEDKEVFRKVFPQLTNPYSQIPEEQRGLYHSLCVLSGNGTTLLWDLIEQEFQKLGLPAGALNPYLQRISQNILEKQAGRWSGPWYRHDQQTIAKNKQALVGKELSSLYQEFENLSRQAGGSNEKHS